MSELCVEGVLYTVDGGADSEDGVATVSTTDGVCVPLSATEKHDDDSVQSDVAQRS